MYCKQHKLQAIGVDTWLETLTKLHSSHSNLLAFPDNHLKTRNEKAPRSWQWDCSLPQSINKRPKISIAALSQESKRCCYTGRLGPLEKANIHHAALNQRRVDRTEKKQNMTPLIHDCGIVCVCSGGQRLKGKLCGDVSLRHGLDPRYSHK
jgi:hypothetical protein